MFGVGDKVTILATHILFHSLNGLTGTIFDIRLSNDRYVYYVRFKLSFDEYSRRELVEYFYDNRHLHFNGEDVILEYHFRKWNLDMVTISSYKRVLTSVETIEYKKLLDKSNRTIIDEFMISSYES